LIYAKAHLRAIADRQIWQQIYGYTRGVAPSASRATVVGEGFHDSGKQMSTSLAEWRVGILFSRGGITEVTESEHFFGTVLAIEEINAAGGVLGRQIVPVAHDPKADSAAYRALARKMLTEEDVNVIFGCSMSASRKAVLPIIERHNGLLLYPSMYEGFEYSENVLYAGATLNQNIFALADFILQCHGKRVLLVGADYIYPRESNRVMRDVIEAKGGEVVAELYVPLAEDPESLARVITEIQHLRPDAVFSTLIGKPAQQFYHMYADAEVDRRKCPIASLTMAESEIRTIGADKCAGHILSAGYFQSLKGDTNKQFVRSFKKRFGEQATTSVWSQPAYVQMHLFARALTRAGSLDTHRISQAILQEEFEGPDGKARFDPETRHIWLTPRIGVAGEDGQFDVVWEAPGPVRPDPYLATSRFEDVWIQEHQ
jgi:urea transport system substrate-binding protein